MRINNKMAEQVKVKSVYEGSQAQKDAAKARLRKKAIEAKPKEEEKAKPEKDPRKAIKKVLKIEKDTNKLPVNNKVYRTSPAKKKQVKKKENKSQEVAINPKNKLMDNLIVNNSEPISDGTKEAELAVGAKKMDEQTVHAPNWLVGLAPLAMGAIMGDIGAGATVAGNTLTEQALHQRDDEDKAIAYGRKLATSNAKSMSNITPRKVIEGNKVIFRYSPKDIEGKEAGYSGSDLTRRAAYLDVGNLKAQQKEKMLGKNLKPMKDSLGRKYLQDMQNPTRKIYLGDKNELSMDQRKVIGSTKDNLRKEVDNKTLGTYRTLANSLVRLSKRNDEGEGNELAGKDALKQYIKRTEGGRLTDFDVEFMQYLFGQEKYKQKIQEFVSGKMNSKLRTDLMDELANDLKFKKREIQRKYRAAYRNGVHMGISPSDMARYVGSPAGLFDTAIVEFKNAEGDRVKTRMPMDKYTNSLSDPELSSKILGVNFE